MADIGLRPYQQEVVERSVRGKNAIIWLPTGAGKTRAAVYVAKKHLETRAQGKVVVIVNTVHLVKQQHKEFKSYLSDYTLTAISGESEEKDFFGKVVEDSHVVFCTAQILYNAMISTEDLKHINLSDISLLIIDECHHTNKETVYNKIMRCYLDMKLEGKGPLPQILGLTASPGAGGARTLEGAVKHVLQFCANLDSAIVSSKTYANDLKETVPRPQKTFDIVEKRPEDPFGDLLIAMMHRIHDYMNAPEDLEQCDFGTQEYEAKVVILEQTGVGENDRALAQCAIHLRKYNDALLINDTLQMMDAYHSLEEFYIMKSMSVFDDTDAFLIKLFKGNRAHLKKLAEDSRYENPKMAKLEEVLLKNFSGSGTSSKAILFTKTCKSTQCLKDWIHNNQALKEVGITASVMIGSSCMTQKIRDGIICHFRKGTINLLVSTSVTEEGLDIPECNLVVRYGLLTNEIAQMQAGGRARAPDSQYSVVALNGGKEVRREFINENLEKLSAKAIAQVQNMRTEDFDRQIADLQRQAMLIRRATEKSRMTKKSRNAAASVQLLCRNCFEPVAFASDIKLYENSLYVNVNPDFKRYYKAGAKVQLERTFVDWEPGCVITCGNGNCNQNWGYEIKIKKVALLPNLAIKHFAMETSEGRITKKKWKDVPFTVENFVFEQYYQDNFSDSD